MSCAWPTWTNRLVTLYQNLPRLLGDFWGTLAVGTKRCVCQFNNSGRCHNEALCLCNMQATRRCESLMAALMHMYTPLASRSGTFVLEMQYWMPSVDRWRHWQDRVLIIATRCIHRTMTGYLQHSVNTTSFSVYLAWHSRAINPSCQKYL